MKVCLVTNELYPLSPGGIGRLMYNFAQQNKSDGFAVDLHILLAADTVSTADDRLDVEHAFSDLASIHYAPVSDHLSSSLGVLLSEQAEDVLSYEGLYAQSLAYAQKLLELEREQELVFDIVEFPDFKGWGTVSMAMKKCGMGFAKTLFSVRLHSTQGILYHFERYAHKPGSWLAYQFELERQGLEFADMVIGHIPAVAEFNKRHYGMSESWAGRLHLEFPPILLENQTDFLVSANVEHEPDHEHPDFIFSSRLQQFKRPDLFILAAINFLSRNKEYPGLFRLVSYGWDRNYIDHLHDLIPHSLSSQIQIIEDASLEQRSEYLKNAIVVIPSDYESLCLFAFETAMMESKVILNKKCQAFGDHARWKHEDNCLLFDGSVSDLTAVMERAITWKPLSYADASPTPAYWLEKPIIAPLEDRPLRPIDIDQVAAAFFGFESPSELTGHLIDCLPALPDGCSIYCFIGEEFFLQDEAKWVSATSDRVSLMLAPGKGYDPSSLSEALAALPSEYLILIGRGYRPKAGAIGTCLKVLGSCETIQFATGHVGLTLGTESAKEVLLYHGKMTSMALQSSRALPGVGVIRRSILSLLPFDTLAGEYWLEAWTRTLVLGGHDTFIIPDIIADWVREHGPVRNSPKLNGYILEQFGYAIGQSTALLTLDQGSMLISECAKQKTLDSAALGSATLINPFIPELGWNLVDFSDAVGGLLVHPIANNITIASIAILGSYSSLRARFCNKHADNSGVEVAIAVSGYEDSAETIEALKRGEFERLLWSGWKRFAAGGAGFRELRLPDGLDNFFLFLLSKVPEGCSDQNCHMVVERVDLNSIVD